MVVIDGPLGATTAESLATSPETARPRDRAADPEADHMSKDPLSNAVCVAGEETQETTEEEEILPEEILRRETPEMTEEGKAEAIRIKRYLPVCDSCFP